MPSEVTAARDVLRDDLGDQGLLTVDKDTGGVRFLARLDGYLDSTPSNSPAATVKDYLRDNADAFGVSAADVSGLKLSNRTSAGGVQSLEFTQMVDGVPVVDSSVQAHLDDSGRLVAISGGPTPDAGLDTNPSVSPDDAAATATEGVATGDDAGTARLVAYTAGDELRLAWRVLVKASSTAQYDTLVDADTGNVVRRSNLVKFASPLFDNYPGAASGGTASSHDLSGYHTPGANALIGPYAHAFVDPDDVVPGTDLNNPVLNPPSQDETPPTSGNDFNYPFTSWNPSPGTQYGGDCQSAQFRCSWDPKAYQDWAANSNHSATQLFWYVNLFHDHLKAAPIGFDAASGNFEQNGTVPAHDDVVVAQAQDGANLDPDGLPDPSHANNGNMLVPPDGQDGLMQMYLWAPWKDGDLNALPNYRAVDGADDPSLVFHEYTHGLTGRLVTDAQGYGALNGAQAGAIDEGTADWYALDYLVEQGLFPDTAGPNVTTAPYEVVGPTGLRSQAIDCTIGSTDPQCPDAGGGAGGGGYTYGDFAKVLGGAEEHADGEIWAQTMWQLRQRLIQVHGPSDPNVQTDGVDRARELLTDGLRLAPPNPSFLDLRNAILLADTLKGLGDHARIWEVFSQRGMGYAASTRGTDDVTPVPDITGPPGVSTPTGSMSGTVRDRDTGAPLSGALVAFSGHDSGLGEDLSTRTAANGTYQINGIPARTWDYVSVAPRTGYDRALSEDVPITAGRVLGRNFTVRRNWALASGGAAVTHHTGADFSSYGCGPSAAIDGTSRTVWSTLTPASLQDPRELDVTLPQAITLGEVRIDPTSGCGDPSTAGLSGYVVQVSANGSSWSTVAQGTFTSANNGRANSLALRSQPAGVRFVRLRGLSTQQSSSPYMDVAELQVYAKAPVPPPQPPCDCPPPPAVAKLKLLTHKGKIGKHRAFAFKVRGPKGMRGNARFTIVIGRGSAARRVTFATARFRLSKKGGYARVVTKVSSRTLRRIKSHRIRVAVTIRAADGQKAGGKLSLTRPKPAKKKKKRR